MTVDTDLEIGILGPTTVGCGGAALALRPRERQLLTALAVDHPRHVTMGALAARLWPDVLPSTALASVKNHVARIRRALGDDAVLTERHGYRLGPRWSVDVERFAAEVERARALAAAGEHREALNTFDVALSYARGGFADELGDADLDAERGWWSEVVATVQDQRLVSLIESGEHVRAVADARLLVDADPFREARWAALAIALYRDDRRREAVQAVARGRAEIREVSGLDAGPQLRSIEARILVDDPSLLCGPLLGGQSTPVVRHEMVGRRVEQRAAATAVRMSAAGRPSLVLIEGEPGIGKSMLCRAVAATASAEGWRVIGTRCLEPGLAPSLWPVVDVIRALAAGTGTATAEAPESRHADTIRRWLDGTDADRPMSAAEVAGVVVDLLDAAGDVPLLVVIDDLQFADEATLDVLVVLAGDLGERRVALLAAHRPTDVGDPAAFGAALGAFTRALPVTRVALTPLRHGEVAQLMELTTGRPPLGDEVGRVLWRSGGNPLFVTELARWEVEGDDAGAAVPQAIREVVRQRLARLPPGTVGELRTVAVIGESFEVATALAATPSDRITCLDALGAAIDAHILRPDGTGYQFAHAIVREAVMADLNGIQLAVTHARVADALEGRLGNQHPDIAEPLAEHRLGALPVGDPLVAAQAAIRAADVARWRGSLDRAGRFADRALDALAGLPQSPELATLQVEAIRALANQAIRRYGSTGLLAVADRVSGLASSDAAHALVLFLRWAPSDAADDVHAFDHLLEPARRLAERSTDRYAISTARCVLGAHLAMCGDLAGGFRELECAVVAVAPDAEAPPAPSLAVIAPFPAGLAAAMLGDTERAREYAGPRTIAWTAHRAPVDATVTATQAFARATVEALLGQPDRVRAELQHATLANDDGFLKQMAPSAEVLLGWARARLGDADGAEQAVRAFRQLESSAELLMRTVFQTFCGDALLAAGDQRAVATLAAARALAERRGEVWWLAETLRLQSIAAEQFGDPGAPELLATARATAKRHGNGLVLARIR